MHGKKLCVLSLVFILFNFLFTVFIPVNGVGENAGMLYSIPSNSPIIDGNIDPTEWQDALPLKVELQSIFLGQAANIQELIIYSLYNDATSTIYLAIQINETIINDNEISIIFQVNKTYPIIQSIIDHQITFSAGNDVKWVSLYNNTSDLRTVEDGYTYDDSFGGTQDFDGKCTYIVGNIDWELAIPFNSGDSLGGDINIQEGDDINLMLEYFVWESNLYSQWNIGYPDWYYYTLHIGYPVSDTTSMSISWPSIVISIISLFSISFVSFINKKH